MKQTMKRALSLALALALSVTLLLPSAWAEGEETDNVTVSVIFDYRSIATDGMLDTLGISYPTNQTVTVPENSTVYAVLEAAKKQGSFTATYGEGWGGIENGYLVSLGDIGYINTLCSTTGATYSDLFQYAGWTYSGDNVDGMGIQSDQIVKDGTITFQYQVYSGYVTAQEWSNFDIPFVDAYYGIQDDITDAKDLTQDQYTETQWETLQSAIINAETTLQTVQTADTYEYLTTGLILNYIAEKQTTLWGPGSPTDQLQSARDQLEKAVHKVVAPTDVSVPADMIEIPMGGTYQLNVTVLPEGAPQDVTYEVIMGGDCFTISDTGLITPTKVSSPCFVRVKSKGNEQISGMFMFKIIEAPEPAADMNALLENIATSYTNSTAHWNVMEMGAYAAAYPSGAKLSETAKQNYINYAINQLVTNQGDWGALGDTDCDKIILALSAIGVDATQLYPVNSNTAINAIGRLNAVQQSTSAWSAPYTLAAYNSGDYASDSYEQTLVDALLNSQQENGCWNEFGTIDTTANVIAGLSYYCDDPSVQEAVNKAVEYLSVQQKSNGVFDDGQTGPYAAGENANSTAMAIVGLTAVGINPDTDERFIKNGKSVLDGLLSFALNDNSGFGYTNNTSLNAGATEQAFRALIAAAQVMKTGEAYNIYDFSGNDVQPGRATGEGEVQKPSAPPEENDNITVTFSMKADTGYWVSPKSVTVKEGSTVYHVFTAALQNTGITYVGAENGYVSSITKDGKTLAEFTNGPDSGWLYKVNGELPDVGLTSYEVSNGDNIVWYYTNDWTKDSLAGQSAKPAEETITTTTTVNNDGTITVTVTRGKETLDSVSGGIKVELPNQSGTGNVVVLVNKDGSETILTKSLVEGESAYALLDGTCTVKIIDNAKAFSDVSDTAWYADAVDFVSGRALYNGTGNGAFSPNVPMSRAMLATVLYRLEGEPESASDVLAGFNDGSDVSAWAQEGLSWAVANKVLEGTDGNRLAADAPITREQLAVMICRYAKLCGLDMTVSASIDISGQGVSSWAETAMAWAVENGIIEGGPGGELNPQDPASRAEVAAILQRLVTVMVK